ncbi:OmpA family protein [Falsiruegeria mediterranea]|uniref:Chromosome partition protein Smc n=1 Tax=Falsiruegeria mediterranea M17 TaxID=1200281 RepID=A0A2R8CAF8_9RHOB|nr:OmpA family protein [Falsiruegeria mediterranea]SPJ29417.1 Chromosome partition protein Smc [Falsiruegeria mediterranea M17]
MRAQARRVSHEEEEESAFVSMTDMTVGFLFIIMILLAFFASQMRDSDTVSRSVFEKVLAERDIWRERAETRAERISQLEEQVSQLEKERDELKLQRDDLQEKLRLAHEKIDEQDAKIADLKAHIAELEQLIKKLKTQLSEKEQKIQELQKRLEELEAADPLEVYLAQVAQTRREVLVRLKDAIQLDFPTLQVELSEESDALRFQGEGLFASGRSAFTSDKRRIVEKLAQRLDQVLPCYTIGEKSKFNTTCNPGFVMIEAVQIEGHTDITGSDRRNRELSTNRANNTFFAMTNAAPTVMEHRNLKAQPVLSVAAYGPDRPVATNETPAGRATNRRIDLRFIMVTPQRLEGIETIRAALEGLSGDEQ